MKFFELGLLRWLLYDNFFKKYLFLKILGMLYYFTMVKFHKDINIRNLFYYFISCRGDINGKNISAQRKWETNFL